MFAIEASPLLTRGLVRNIETNHLKNVRVVNAAAGSSAGKVNIVYSPAENTGLTRVTQGEDVRCDALTEFVGSDYLSRVRMITIDVEGAECDLIEGIAPVLSQLPQSAEVLAEVGPDRARDPEQVKSLFAPFENAGFSRYSLPNNYETKFYLLDPVPESIVRIRTPPIVECDAVFSRHDQATLALR